MKDELFERIVMYKATMSLVKSMLAEGLICAANSRADKSS